MWAGEHGFSFSAIRTKQKLSLDMLACVSKQLPYRRGNSLQHLNEITTQRDIRKCSLLSKQRDWASFEIEITYLEELQIICERTIFSENFHKTGKTAAITQQQCYARSRSRQNNSKTTRNYLYPVYLSDYLYSRRSFTCHHVLKVTDWLIIKIYLWLMGLYAWNAEDPKNRREETEITTNLRGREEGSSDTAVARALISPSTNVAWTRFPDPSHK